MNISLKNNDTTSGIIKIEIGQSDYAEQVEKSLKNIRKKANIP